MTPTNWLPGLLALGAALVAAAGYVLLSLRRSKPSGAQADASRRTADLDAQYQSAILQLKELKAEQHHLTPEAYAAQRAELEQRAANALRSRDAQAPAAPPGVPPHQGTGFFVRHPQLVGAFWGGGVVAFFGLLGALLFFQSKPDPQRDMPRGPMQSQATEPQGPDDLDQAMEQLNSRPDDMETASLVGHELIRRQRWPEASQVTERALGEDPYHPENRIHRAVLRAQRGDAAGAEVELQHLADTYPATQEALLFLASIQAQAGDKAKALDSLERYVAVAPPEEQSAELYQAMARFRRELGKPPAP